MIPFRAEGYFVFGLSLYHQKSEIEGQSQMSEHWQGRQRQAQEINNQETEESNHHRGHENIPDSRDPKREENMSAATTSPPLSSASTFRVPQSSSRGGFGGGNGDTGRSSRLYEDQQAQSSRRAPYDVITDSTSTREHSFAPLREGRGEHSWRHSSSISGLGMPATPDLTRPLSSASSSGASSSHHSAFASPSYSSTGPLSAKGNSRNYALEVQQQQRSSVNPLITPSYTPSSYQTRDSSTSQANYDRLPPQAKESPSLSSSSAPLMEHRQRPSVDGFSRVRNGRKYRLVVVQHPTRARMCGFGDKDRRPLSPTLIVKLIITDEATGKEISPWNVNTSLFFLASDLCHPDELILSPRNVLVHQHAASVPTAMLQQQQQQQQQQSEAYDSLAARQKQYISPSSALHYNPAIDSVPHDSNTYDNSEMIPHRSHPSTTSSSSSSGLTTFTTEHYTRNLVGAAVTSANVLRDEQDVHTIFFILQDLSIRTEGIYRIRLIFTDLAQQ